MKCDTCKLNYKPSSASVVCVPALKARVRSLRRAIKKIIDSPACADDNCCDAMVKYTKAIEYGQKRLKETR